MNKSDSILVAGFLAVAMLIYATAGSGIGRIDLLSSPHGSAGSNAGSMVTQTSHPANFVLTASRR
jgi:hypothetical protein